MYYLNNFFLFAVFGFIYENILSLILSGSLSSNPFYGPWMPIYGFGIVIMLLLREFVFKNFNIPRVVKIVMLFLLTIIILTVLELLGGVLTEAIFHKSFWDYSLFRFNYGKYIALEVSLTWGVASLIFLYLIKPLTDKFIKKIPNNLTIFFIAALFLDFLFSFVFGII